MERQKEILTIGDRMTPKPATIQSDQTVGDAFVLMYERDIRHLPVIEQSKLIGIVSDRDIRQFLGRARIAYENMKEEERYLRLPVKEIMSLYPVTVRAETPIGKGVKIMVEKKIGALPVVDLEERVIGIFTELDALQYCLHLMERYQGMRA
jgi:acetoin utilization protein AcuB